MPWPSVARVTFATGRCGNDPMRDENTNFVRVVRREKVLGLNFSPRCVKDTSHQGDSLGLKCSFSGLACASSALPYWRVLASLSR